MKTRLNKTKSIVLLIFLLTPVFCFAQNKSGFEFIQQDISEIIYSVSLANTKPIVCDDTVVGRASFRFAGSDFESAFDSFLSSNRLYVTKGENVWTVSRIKIDSGDSAGIYNIDAYDVLPMRLFEKISEITGKTIIHETLPAITLSIHVNNNPVNFRDLRGLENVYFLYTFDESDSFMKLQERWTIENDKRYLEKNGLSVKIVESATKQDILDALYDSDAMLIITSGHGDARGGIYTADNSKLKLTDIDSTQIGSNLKTVIFENCHQGTYEKEWETVLGGNVDVVGWTGITRTYETIGFNTLGWFDRQDKRLKDYEHDIVEYAQSSKNKCQNTTH